MGTEAFKKNDCPVLSLKGVAQMLSDRCGGQDHNEWVAPLVPVFLKTDLCRLVGEPCKENLLRKHWLYRSWAYHPICRRAEKSWVLQADMANTIFAPIVKKAKLHWCQRQVACGLGPYVKCLSGKCGGQVEKHMFSRMLTICPYLGILIGGTARTETAEIFPGIQTLFTLQWSGGDRYHGF